MATSVTVALDLGSTHSGYVLRDVRGLIRESRFVHGEQELTRVPSCVLLSPDRSLHSYGWNARMQHHQLVDSEGCLYFQGLPCLGPSSQVERAPLMLHDHSGSEVLPAKDVLAIFIGCLKNHVISTLGSGFQADDVTWVLTLPAKCDVTVIDMLMDAATQAGLPEHQLKQVSGMEAAALHMKGSSLDLGQDHPLTLVLVDCGGGAVTASVFEATGDSDVTEKCGPFSSEGGGGSVDTAFEEFLKDLAGPEVLEGPVSAEVARAIRAFVAVKHMDVESEKVAVTLPQALVDRLQGGLPSSPWRGRASLIKNKLLLTLELYRTFFDRAVDAVISTIEQALCAMDDCPVDAILLFGGFSQCRVVKDAVGERFPRLKLKVLPFPETAVARGAVARYCEPVDVTSGDAAAAGGKDGPNTDARTDGSRLVVVAIDFGTTYSGYAFSFLEDMELSPPRVWSQNFLTDNGQEDKVPTTVLFTPDQKFHSFGQEAEKTFNAIFDKDKAEAKKWYLFEKFKMTLLRQKDLSEDSKLHDESKKKWMLALDVFAAAIGFLKGHAMGMLQERKAGVREADVQWVLTVPAIWDDKARQFMHRAADKAGIPGDHLQLALEPEAASVYCLKYFQSHPLPLFHPSSPSTPFSLSQPGKRFLLVDNGGGTIDISAFEVTDGAKLRQLHRASGTDKGGMLVNEALKEFLSDMVGFDGLTSFERLEMLTLFLNFEFTKRNYDGESSSVHIKIPPSMVPALEDALSQTRKETYSDVKLTQKVLALPKAIFESFFQKSIESITSTIKAVLDDENVGSVDAILLAGGFSESHLIQEAVRKAFPRDLVLVAHPPSAAVVMGAVIFGFTPDVITTRVSAYTYGVSSCRRFQEDDDESKAIVVDGKKWVKDAFVVYIRQDQEVGADSLLPYRTYRPAGIRQRQARIEIFRSSCKAPRYVDEFGCEKIGTVTVEMPDTTDGRQREVRAAMKVGGTELSFIARDETTQREFAVQCEFLARM